MVLEKILAIPMQLFGEKEDSLVWKLSQTSSAYDLAKPEHTSPYPFLGNWIWKLDTLPKIIHFMWLCHHHSVPVRQVLSVRGIPCNTCYPLCQN